MLISEVCLASGTLYCALVGSIGLTLGVLSFSKNVSASCTFLVAVIILIDRALVVRVCVDCDFGNSGKDSSVGCHYCITVGAGLVFLVTLGITGSSDCAVSCYGIGIVRVCVDCDFGNSLKNDSVGRYYCLTVVTYLVRIISLLGTGSSLCSVYKAIGRMCVAASPKSPMNNAFSISTA